MRHLALLPLLAAAPAIAKTPDVVADIAPVHALVAQVMGDHGTPRLLVDSASDPHTVQLRPSQARAISEADLVVWMGPDFAPWLARALANNADVPSLSLLEWPGTHLREKGEDAHDDHAGEHADGHANEHADGHDDHDHGPVDPHAWLSPENGHAWIDAIARTLSQADPENAAGYEANAAAAHRRLAGTEARIEELLAPYEGVQIMTFHDAFGYFAEAFGLEIIGSVRPSDATSPSAATLSGLQATVEAHDVACAFAEPGYDPALLETISRGALKGADIPMGTLDPVGRSLTPGPEMYFTLLEDIAANIADCLAR